MALTNEQRKGYRSIGHTLKPVVTVGGNGLSSGVMEELNRALDDHELIKIKISVGDRDLKKQCVDELIKITRAELVQQIGNTALLLRRNPKAKASLSNIIG